MTTVLWANLINMYQPPGRERSELEEIITKSYLPLLRIFEHDPRQTFSLNIPGCTVELLIKAGFGNLIKKIVFLADRGQIDFTATPKYQPFLPLQSEDDIDRQIEAHNKICKRYLGLTYNPQGFYSPHLIYCQKAVKAAARFGLKWIAIDELSIANGPSGGLSYLLLDKSAGGIVLIPCHRELSAQLAGSFRAKKMPRSSSEFMQNALSFCSGDKYFVTAVEADRFGYAQNARHAFLRGAYRDNKAKAISVSELRKLVRRKEFSKPIDTSAETFPENLKKQPFISWQNENNPIQQTLWKLYELAAYEIKNASLKGDNQLTRAKEMIDSASAGHNWLMASASPFWESAYPQKAADDLAIAIFILSASSPKTKDEAIALRQKVHQEIERFEKSGQVKKMQRDYLRSKQIPFERFFNKQEPNRNSQ